MGGGGGGWGVGRGGGGKLTGNFQDLFFFNLQNKQ